MAENDPRDMFVIAHLAQILEVDFVINNIKIYAPPIDKDFDLLRLVQH